MTVISYLSLYILEETIKIFRIINNIQYYLMKFSVQKSGNNKQLSRSVSKT